MDAIVVDFLRRLDAAPSHLGNPSHRETTVLRLWRELRVRYLMWRDVRHLVAEAEQAMAEAMRDEDEVRAPITKRSVREQADALLIEAAYRAAEARREREAK